MTVMNRVLGWKMGKSKPWLVSMALAVAPLAGADELGAAQQLTQRLEPVASYVADFTQRIEGNGHVAQQSTGHMWVARPGKFRWVVDAPYSQTVVSDGKDVYLYDPDLQQVTIRKLDPKVTNTPALLLSGQASELVHSYSVAEQSKGSKEMYSLTPKRADTLFNRLQMTFDNGRLSLLDMYDASGQHTQVAFNNVQLNAAINASAFQFETPKGADVIRE